MIGPCFVHGLYHLSDEKEAVIIQAINSTSRYLDNPYFESMAGRIYPPELQLYKTNASDTEATCLDQTLAVSNVFVSSQIYHKRD